MGWPPLVYTYRGNKGENPSKVRRLIALGADVDVRNYKGKTALHCTTNFVQVMKLLIGSGNGYGGHRLTGRDTTL